jgi:DNA-binding XRE family transcriptional regulator
MKIFGKDLTQQELGRLMQEAREGKRYQEGKRISREMIGTAIGVDKQTIYEWERGNKHPSFLNVCKFCDYLDITLDELLGVKPTRYFHLTMSEEERDEVFSLLDACEQESKKTPRYSKLHTLKQSVRVLFSRAFIR